MQTGKSTDALPCSQCTFAGPVVPFKVIWLMNRRARVCCITTENDLFIIMIDQDRNRTSAVTGGVDKANSLVTDKVIGETYRVILDVFKTVFQWTITGRYTSRPGGFTAWVSNLIAFTLRCMNNKWPFAAKFYKSSTLIGMMMRKINVLKRRQVKLA
jgi:hypothetical protein